MPNVAQITQMRQRRRTREQRNPSGRIALGCSTLISLLLALGGIFLTLSYSDLSRDLPSVEALPTLLEPPDGILLQPTRLYDQNGEHVLLTLQNPAAAEREYLQLAAEPNSDSDPAEGPFLPNSLVTATLASADPNFWEHSGVSFTGILQGYHTTLAQRLANDLLLQGESPGLRRALREGLLAAQITTRFGRQKVLEWYLNSANYGRLAYGADAAARVYFGKSGTELNLAEGAMLAAVAEAPTLNPMDAPQAALERQKRTIQAMLHYRMISPEQGIQAAQEELAYRQTERQGMALTLTDLEPNLAPAFASLVLNQLEAYIPRSRLERGGLRVFTTLDHDLQSQAACAAKTQLARSQAQQEGDLIPPTRDCDAARLLPSLPFQLSSPSGRLDAEVLILDPLSGQVLALVGNPPKGLEEAPLPSHSPGSLTTPIIYLTAFTRGSSPATLVWDIPLEKPQTELQNFDGRYHGPLRLRYAFANDYLVPAEKVLAQVGIENVWRTAQQLGIRYPQAPDTGEISTLSLLREVNLVEIGQTFGIYANQGVLAGRPIKTGAGVAASATQPTPLHPVTTQRVEDVAGRVWLDWSTYQTRPIISSQLAYLMTSVMSDETARWPSLGHPNPLEIGRPAAAKLGRTEIGESNWALGYTPQLVVGVWIGGQESQGGPQNDEAHILQSATAGLWHAIVQYASRDLPYQVWTVPAGLSTVQVCDPSGMLPTEDCPNVVDEIFLAGSEPVQFDRLYRSLQINHETDRLATVFTPSDLVKERVYFLAPPEAAKWARQMGLETPPEVYDAVPAIPTTWQETAITSPAMFETVGGRVTILGKASGDGLTSYRIQVGQGLNPQNWLQVSQDGTQAVEDGQLGLWDTNGLSGLYAVQLLVIRQDQSAERATVLVTVDNQAPEVRITYPVDGERISLSQRESIVLQAEVHDDLEVASVAFYLNDNLIATLTQPPYGISWKAKSGVHNLRVEAKDRADNSNQARATFEVK